MKKVAVFLCAFLVVLFAFGTANAAFLNGKQIYAAFEQPLANILNNYGLLNVGPFVEITYGRFWWLFSG